MAGVLAVSCAGGKDSGEEGPGYVSSARDYTWVDAGTIFDCAVHAGGQVECWGPYGDNGVRKGLVAERVSVGEYGCALQTDGHVTCWGCEDLVNVDTWESLDYGQCDAPDEVFLDIAANSSATCGIQANGDIACWGAVSDENASPYSGDFVRLEWELESSLCAIDASGDIDRALGSEKHEGNFVAVGDCYYGKYTCGIHRGAEIECWGDALAEYHVPTTGSFIDISVNAFLGCAIALDGSIQCWSDDSMLEQHPAYFDPPDGIFTQVSTNYSGGCALRNDGAVVCWGDKDFAPP
jgi:hypothetical protein